MRNTVALHTLGCKLNHVETSALGQRFVERGFEIVEFGTPADVIVINSCTVTTAADAECRQLIGRAHRTSPNADILVTGCYAERNPDALRSIPGVTAVIGNSNKHKIADFYTSPSVAPTGVASSEVAPTGVAFSEVAPTGVAFSEVAFSEVAFCEAKSLGEDSRTRAFFKLQDGCDYSCTFCTIPAVRGAARALPFEHLHHQIIELTESGCKEVVLTGVNLGEYQAPSGERFIDVLRAFHNAQPPFRVRISSIEPNTVSDNIIDLVATSNIIAPHFHLPLQSGSAQILRAMKRRYNADRYRNVVERIIERMPHACIGIDVITGFPGETDEHFNETVTFLDSLPFSYLHIFTFSERPGTPAATMPNSVPQRIRKQRTKVLGQLSMVKKSEFYERNMGTSRTMLPESFNDATQTWSGWTENYLRVSIPGTIDQSKDLHLIQIQSHL